MKIEALADADAVARTGAAFTAGEARAAVAARGRFIMAVSGGHTPWKMLRALADQPMPWADVHVVQVDERVAPAGDPDRNLTHLRESLLAHCPLRPEQVHAMPVESADLESASGQYAVTLQRVAGAPAVLDLAHLGLGPDGHTASLVPGDPVLDVTDADVALTGFYQSRRRMTLTYPVLNVLAQSIPWLLGGSADLGPSNKTTLTYEGAGSFQAGTPGGKNLHFGIREHAMAAIVNGLSLSKLRAFGATFFIFSDYARPAIRLSALMELPTIFVFTHDAMGDGEDGPTHQPVEHLASLRAIPGLITLRPGDANEVVEAYRCVMQLRHQPTVLVLSRQPLPTLDRHAYAPATGVARGAYVLADPPEGNPEVILIASGSELSLAVEAHGKLLAEGIRSRVVSMPSWEIFEQQTQEYRDGVLPPGVRARVAIEQASTFGWERYVGRFGHVIGMRTFGASAPLKALQEKFGFEPERVAASARELLGKQ